MSIVDFSLWFILHFFKGNGRLLRTRHGEVPPSLELKEWFVGGAGWRMLHLLAYFVERAAQTSVLPSLWFMVSWEEGLSSWN